MSYIFVRCFKGLALIHTVLGFGVILGFCLSSGSVGCSSPLVLRIESLW